MFLIEGFNNIPKPLVRRQEPQSGMQQLSPGILNYSRRPLFRTPVISNIREISRFCFIKLIFYAGYFELRYF